VKFSVVIPVYNGSRTLPACLEALSAQYYRDFEVYLVDNNSKDDSVDIILQFLTAHPDFPGQLLHEPRQGACPARNTGARAATGQVIANIDPDCLPDPDWLTDLAEAFADGEAAAVAGNIESRAPENIYETFAALHTLPGRSQLEEYRAYMLTYGGYATANLAITKTWFERLGGFDESINYKGVGIGEDHDILARLYAAGGMLRAVPNAAVAHWHRSDLRGIVRQGFLFGLAQALLTRRHGRNGVLFNVGGREMVLPAPVKGWVEFDSLNKKVVSLLATGLLHPLLLATAPCYLLWQVLKVRRRLHSKGLQTGVSGSFALVFLLLAKTTAMTYGRLRGSLSEKVICI
jgi:glycosyltransferase involved in cell wall biosynthesis